MRELSLTLAAIGLAAVLVSPHLRAQPAAPTTSGASASPATGVATAALLGGPTAPEQLDEARTAADENRENVFQHDIGARTRHAIELEIITDRDWNQGDQHGSIGVGFTWSLSLQRPENFRLLGLYAGVLFGQLGDERHEWAHFQGGYRPTLEIPVDFEIKPYFGPRAIFAASFIDGPGPRADGTFAVGGAVGGRLLGGFLSAEVSADAVYSLGTSFRVNGNDDSNDWIPRVGLNIKTDLCAFLGGDECQYRAPTPTDVDLSLIMSAALEALAKKLITKDPASCAPVHLAVSLQTDVHRPTCGPADVEGFFCRLGAESPADKRVAVDLARQVHSELEACYSQGRVDERAAEQAGKILVRKLRYGAYAPEFRRVMGCDTEAERVPRMEPKSEELRDDLAAQVERADDKLELAREACPLGALALRRLAEHCAH